MADNGNSVLDGLYALAKSLPNKKNRAKAYILGIIGNVTASTSAACESGSGDMTAAVYDPTGVAGDAFDYNNFSNTPTIPTSVDSLGPSQATHAGKYLKTDGTNASWATIPGTGPQVTILTVSGAWYVPANWNNANNTIECYGGGGGGRSIDGGGGGGGAYASISNLSLTPSTLVPFTVGAAGTASSGSGGNGGDTYFISPSTVLAKGGAGATSRTGAAGGAAASCVGSVKYSGGKGGSSPSGNPGGGGGGAAGPAGAGGAGSDATTLVGGNGGQANNGTGALGGLGYTASTTGGGGGGGGMPTAGTDGGNGPGGAGGAFGGGGGGGGTTGTRLAGTGGAGFIVVTYTP